MELIEGNLLFFIVLLEAVGFLVVWSNLYDGAIRWVFIFSRGENLKYELRLAVKLIIGISITGIVLYRLLCASRHYSGVPAWYMVLILLVPVTDYLLISGATVSKNVGMVVLTFLFCISGPMVWVAAICLWHIKLDAYCGYGSWILLAADFFLGRRFVLQWKKGDV